MTPRRTMSIAQQLYEGVDIAGHGTMGLITYMRTDSLRLSDEAVAAARAFAGARYGQEYLPEAPRQFKAKAGGPGCPRGHPPLQRGPHPGERPEEPDPGAVPPL
mgnify:CR=1 FL=1